MNECHKHEPEVGLMEEVVEATVISTSDGREILIIREEILIEIEDLEHHGKHGTQPQRAKSYRIVIDRQPHTVHQQEMSGRELLRLAGKTPEAFTLTEKLHGGKRARIEPDQIVIFSTHGVERFETAPRSANNGEAMPKGPLTQDDVDYLNSTGYAWEAAPDSGGHTIVLKSYRLSPAFTPCVVDLMLRIPSFYPAAMIDMFNTLPAVARADSRPLACLSLFQFQGETWQQWSRHRSSWDANVDCVATHMALVENALALDAA